MYLLGLPAPDPRVLKAKTATMEEPRLEPYASYFQNELTEAHTDSETPSHHNCTDPQSRALETKMLKAFGSTLRNRKLVPTVEKVKGLVQAQCDAERAAERITADALFRMKVSRDLTVLRKCFFTLLVFSKPMVFSKAPRYIYVD